MTPASILALLYPYLLSAADPRFATEQERQDALTLAASYRPGCLTTDRQDVAQAHYAAYLLSNRAALTSGTSTSTTAGLPGGEVIEWVEGNVRIKYAPAKAARTTSGTSAGVAPSDPYAAWSVLNDICVARVRGGAFLTGWGP